MSSRGGHRSSPTLIGVRLFNRETCCFVDPPRRSRLLENIIVMFRSPAAARRRRAPGASIGWRGVVQKLAFIHVSGGQFIAISSDARGLALCAIDAGASGIARDFTHSSQLRW